MLEALVLGIVQGVTEWIPISSEGMLVLVQVHLFGQTSLTSAIEYAFFLHIGTMLAALVYFRRDIWRMCASVYVRGPERQLLSFVIITTLVTAPIAYGLLQLVTIFEHTFTVSAKAITALIAVALTITGLLLLQKGKAVVKNVRSTTVWDALLTGLGQGLSIIPGISRSGTTMAILLLRRFAKEDALKLSFIAGIPVVFGWALLSFLGVGTLPVTVVHLISGGIAFVVGLLTIHLLMRIAARVRFGVFLLIFAGLTFLALLL